MKSHDLISERAEAAQVIALAEAEAARLDRRAARLDSRAAEAFQDANPEATRHAWNLERLIAETEARADSARAKARRARLEARELRALHALERGA